jgi:hypothetical protein
MGICKSKGRREYEAWLNNPNRVLPATAPLESTAGNGVDWQIAAMYTILLHAPETACISRVPIVFQGTPLTHEHKSGEWFTQFLPEHGSGSAVRAASGHLNLLGCLPGKYAYFNIHAIRDTSTGAHSNHAMTVFVNMSKLTFAIFDPNGYDSHTFTKRVDAGLIPAVQAFLNSEVAWPLHIRVAFEYTTLPIASVCPKAGPQSRHPNSFGAPGGLCLLWSLFYIWWRIVLGHTEDEGAFPDAILPNEKRYNKEIGPEMVKFYSAVEETHAKWLKTRAFLLQSEEETRLNSVRRPPLPEEEVYRRAFAGSMMKAMAASNFHDDH